MNQESPSFEAMLPIMLTEAWRRRIMLVVIFSAIALIALAIGLMWPKKYDASVTILAQKHSIITPLMEGAATPTGNATRASMARAVIFSGKVMDEVLLAGGWMAAHPTPVQQDQIIHEIKSRTKVVIRHDNLITITYNDSNAKRAFEVTRTFGKLFISESIASKQHESRDAFDFINGQVDVYRNKLNDAETKLKDYRDANSDARPGIQNDTNSRISQLRTQIENARLSLTEKHSEEASLMRQLTGESEVTSVQTTAGVYQAQLAQLQSKLDKLLLTYTSEYPDVVRTRHQIQDLRQQLAQENKRKQDAKQSGTPTALDDNVQFNPLYQQIKTKLSAVRSDIAALGARMAASQTMLKTELERSSRIADSENVTAELTRDYNVNRDVYQSLLKRRENARISMNLDAKHQGLTFVIQNPAVMPLTPSGLRFMHFALIGGVLSLGIPFGLLFAIARFDPRVRSAKQLERTTGLAVLATVPFYPTPHDRQRDRMANSFMIVLVVGVAAAYLVVLWLKLKGAA
jgi:polysaccharide chain length determinant protein (PEP-CTERM system associated)